MKNGKRLTRAEKEIVKSYHLNPRNWLRERHTPTVFIIMHKYTGNTKTLKSA